MGKNCIFITCDSSDWHTRAVLSYGPTLETAQPIAFDLMALKAAQLNYPVHEKELLAIICALQKWCSELLGVAITIYTDHCRLENFDQQNDLSHQQAHWQEFLAQYDHEIMYILGDANCVANALSRLPNAINDVPVPLASMLTIETDPMLLQNIQDGYLANPFCTKLSGANKSIKGICWDGSLIVYWQPPDYSTSGVITGGSFPPGA
jgi:hypothetical protein